MNEGPSKPLVTISFERTIDMVNPDEWSVDRYWYHVPRVGDYVAFGEGDAISGKVTTVFWSDDRVVVRFR